ncbi:MAG: glycosyltransferase family 4 protein, partial [Planctomycetota bacterium]
MITCSPVGVRAFFQGQFAYLQEQGFQFTVVCPEATRPSLLLPDATAYVAVALNRTITPWSDLRALWRVWGMFRRGRFDLVQYTTPKGALVGSLAAFAARVPVRLYLAWGIYYVGQTGLKRALFKILDRLICRLSTHVTFDGFGIRQFALHEGLCSPQKSSVVGQGSDNGIDLTLFDPERWREAGRTLRRQYGIPDDALVIGSVMRLVGDKGINELVVAFESVAAERPNVRLLLVGCEEEKDRPRPETRERLANDPRIIITGIQDNIFPYYTAMDLFALPTYREGFSAVTLEAAAMALPVVTTAVIGAGESIVDGRTGFAVPAKSVTPLADALARLLEDPQLRQVMGQAGRRWIAEKFEQRKFWEAVRRHREDLLVRSGRFALENGRLVRHRRSHRVHSLSGGNGGNRPERRPGGQDRKAGDGFPRRPSLPNPLRDWHQSDKSLAAQPRVLQNPN